MQISKLERGITREASSSTLRALCQALGVSPSYILGMTEDMDVRDVEEEEEKAGAEKEK